MKQERLVGVIHELTMGGAERMMVNILNHFSVKGQEVHLVIFKNIGTLKALLDPNIVIHDLESASVKKSMPKCLKKLHTIKPSIVFTGIGHVNIALAPFIPMMRYFLPKTRWISRETNIVSMQNQEGKYPKLFDWLYRNVYKNYDVIISQSQDMHYDLERYYPSCAKKSRVINNPINIDKVEAYAQEKIAFPFQANTIKLITVGTLRERKRQDLLLRSVAKLAEKYTLVIVGAGEEEASLKHLADELKITHRVVFEGHQSNPYPYMKEADLFILTSEHEGFPNVLLEANSLGVPIVAFASPGGINEIIEEGINGFTAPFGEIETLALTIEKAIAQGFDSLQVVDCVRRRYADKIIMEKYEKVFYA